MTLARFRLLFLATTLLSFIWPMVAFETMPANPFMAPLPEVQKPSLQYTNAKYYVPILMYHYIRDNEKPTDILGRGLSVSSKNFEQQLLWLKNHGYETVGPDFLIAPYHTIGKPIILTFDDGYRDAFTHAFPILKNHGLTGTFYVIVDGLGDPAYLTWDQVKIMKAGGMNMASHTLNHLPLARLTIKNIARELTESKRELDARLNQNTLDFAYPYGSYDSRVVAEAKKAGYQTAVTVNSGVATEKNKMLELPRLRVSNNTNLENLFKDNF